MELSAHLESTGCEMADDGIGRRSDDKSGEESRIRDVERVWSRWSDTSQRSSDGADREWVVRRRSDGSRYIGRRRRDQAGSDRQAAETHHRHADPARRSWPRPTSYHSPASNDQPHGCPEYDAAELEVDDVVQTVTKLDRWTSADYDDYGTVQWICSPHCTDSSYRIVAVI